MDGDQARPLELELHAPAHTAAFAYWQTRKPSPALLPSRQDLDPLDMPRKLLPWVNLIEVHRNGVDLRYRHRLVGTGIVDMRNRDGTGFWFDQLYETERTAQIRRVLDLVVHDAHPYILDDDLGSTGRPYRTLHSLVLPLATDGVTVDMLMAVSHYD
ncbi:MAG: PAS domain-containing protein [Alphaproteobacteria bacterium]|nr:PAS domain-containing protein [Alphaproteobacteria bacterium]